MHEKKITFSTKMVIACVAAWIAFFVVYAVYKFNNPMGTWDATFTGAWFASWGGELVALATIKVSKIKNKYETE